MSDVTVQYITCADPTESAARRQRVIQGEARNLMNNTADRIIEADVASAPSPSLSRQRSPPPQTSRPSQSTDNPPPAKGLEKQAKRGRGRPPLAKQNPKPPAKLTGAKSQKRNLVQGSPKKNVGNKASTKPAASQGGPSLSKPSSGNLPISGTNPNPKSGNAKGGKASNPKISLVPATKK